MKLLFATRNRGKLLELRSLVDEAGGALTLVTLDDLGITHEVVEDRETFEGNARKKAEELSLRSGIYTLADDSGLEVDALGGAPGVRSARYAGDEHDDVRNTVKLLAALAQVPTRERQARFRCVLALARAGKTLAVEQGTLDGAISLAPRGDNGFGYDPVFLVSPSTTLAEMSLVAKNKLSHRGQALRRMARRLAEIAESASLP